MGWPSGSPLHAAEREAALVVETGAGRYVVGGEGAFVEDSESEEVVPELAE